MQRERGTDLTIFSPRASFMAHHIGNETTSREWSEVCNDLIARVCGLYPDNFVGVCQLPQSPGVAPEHCVPRARALRARSGLRRLQPESRSVGRALEGAAADRPLVVPAVREDGRARRAGDGPCQHVVQPVLSRDRRALPQCGHDRVHAVPDLRSVQGFPDAAGSSSRTAAAQCPTTGAAFAGSRRT